MQCRLLKMVAAAAFMLTGAAAVHAAKVECKHPETVIDHPTTPGTRAVIRAQQFVLDTDRIETNKAANGDGSAEYWKTAQDFYFVEVWAELGGKVKLRQRVAEQNGRYVYTLTVSGKAHASTINGTCTSLAK